MVAKKDRCGRREVDGAWTLECDLPKEHKGRHRRLAVQVDMSKLEPLSPKERDGWRYPEPLWLYSYRQHLQGRCGGFTFMACGHQLPCPFCIEERLMELPPLED